jgi:hypothetical protein
MLTNLLAVNLYGFRNLYLATILEFIRYVSPSFCSLLTTALPMNHGDQREPARRGPAGLSREK